MISSLVHAHKRRSSAFAIVRAHVFLFSLCRLSFSAFRACGKPANGAIECFKWQKEGE
jgi:hypothetical protein